ncbi:WXG100 family type VII secretion target [Actinoplanes sp. NPDC051513]|uniref:WXG100 family type VII secretion target n=1 Tax=Actinoplanes sp. NPDC051513 TaxID=3363908 RepID=UPI0037BC4873
MAGISLQGLLHADTPRLRAVAAQWDRLVEDIDDTVEDLVQGTRDLPHFWAGEGAQAAQERNLQLQLQIGNAHRYCGKIAETLRRFAYDIEHYQQMLHGVVAEARGDGLEVDLASGRITAPVTGTQASVDAYVAQIEEILAKANDADRQARVTIEENQLREEERPEGELPEVSVEFLLVDVGPDLRAQAWHAIHPLNREKLIEEHPELVGPAVGLPSDARDRANRLLLERNKAALLTRRQRLDDLHDDAGSRATMDAEAGLADIDAIEKRLVDHPGSRLMNYPPAVLAEGDPKWDNYVPPVKLKK